MADAVIQGTTIKQIHHNILVCVFNLFHRKKSSRSFDGSHIQEDQRRKEEDGEDAYGRMRMVEDSGGG